MSERNGMYYVTVRFGADGGIDIAPRAMSARVSVEDEALLWATRFNTNSDGFRRVAAATDGIPTKSEEALA